MDKLRIYHFHNGGGGGVLTVIKNLLRFSNDPLIENHIIYTINRDKLKHYQPEQIEGAASQQVFFYSTRWNILHTCRQLAKLIPDEKAILIAHDLLELAMAGNLGLQNKIVQVVHGDYQYYYDLAVTNEQAIDAFVTVAGTIQKKLQSLLPSKKDSIFYLPFPLLDASCKGDEKRDNSIVFVGRCTEEKGYPVLPSVAKLVQGHGNILLWHIVGKISSEIKAKYLWDTSVNVKFYGEIPNEDVNELLCKMKYFILPSLAEGTPVSLIEAMKAGAVSLVNNLPGGIQELVKNGETGFLAQNNLPGEYAAIIHSLQSDEQLQEKIRNNSRRLSNDLFNPARNTKAYENVYKELSQQKAKVKPVIKVYCSRLDNPLYPNWMVTLLRKLQNKKVNHTD